LLVKEQLSDLLHNCKDNSAPYDHSQV